jgi:hypothetical protein|tara:strand:+ start:186 stop:464 length:279 start_codon:yes stop_codon:yes gene_type:complete
MGRDKQKIGDVSEFKAVIKFLQEDYWVFRNVQGSGPIDMVLVHKKTGEVRKIDVKTTSYRKSWRPGTKICRQRTPEQIQLKVEYAFMEKDDV